MGYEVSLGLKVGAKHPAGSLNFKGTGVKASVRHEWSPFDGFSSHSPDTARH